jgi:predicted nucleotidyltransferase component of viral defense system
MRTLPEALRLDIEDASNAGLLASLPPAVIEKDVHITEVLAALAAIRLSHQAFRQHAGNGPGTPAAVEVATRLVFAGGTCLAKAHGLIERMSEDIDIKVVLDPVPEGYALPKNQGDRKRLGDLHKTIQSELLSLGFGLVQGEHLENPEIRNNRRHCGLALAYQARFQDVSGALRPELKLELIHRHPVLPAQEQELGFLFDRLVPGVMPFRFKMPVISVAETLAEKVLSLLRRSAKEWRGQTHVVADAALVRHVYDVWRIASEQAQAVEAARDIFPVLVATDVEEYKTQDADFAAAPYPVLRSTLTVARNHQGLRQNFDLRLKPLLFAQDRPDFDTCFETFERVASRLLNFNL